MGSANSQKLLDDFSNDFFGSMQEQLHEERVTLSSLMKGLRCQDIGPHPDGIPTLGKLSKDYEGELKEAFKREMRGSLQNLESHWSNTPERQSGPRPYLLVP